MQEQRLTLRLLQHWNLLRKDMAMPEVERLNTAPIADLWPQCFMVSVDSRRDTPYRYEYMGENIVKTYGRDLTGQAVEHRVKQFPGIAMYKRLGEVVNGRQACEDGGHFISENGKMVKYRACFLPFGAEKKAVTHVVVGLSFRTF